MTKLQLREKSLQPQPLMFSQLTLLAQQHKHLHPMLSLKLLLLLPLLLKLTMSRPGQVAQGKDLLAHNLLVDFNYIALSELLFVIYLFVSSLYLNVV
jgi:hypothetical protein